MLNGQDSGALPAEATARLNHYYQVDGERQSFIQGILQQMKANAERIRDLELDLDDQKRSRLNYQAKSANLEDDMSRMRKQINRDSFVVVLIDGDGAKFADEFLRDPIAGSERAALKLRQAVRENLRDTGLGHEDVPILVRVYANLNDLAKSLRMSYIINQDDDMRVFAEHFTNVRADCDFINVGKGKENADSKMRRMLNHYHRNIQCKKIFLAGCCHDNGYLHDLRDFAGEGDNRLVLLETTPAEPGFRLLGFPILRFDNVFRAEPLNNETKRVIPTMPVHTRSPPRPTPGPIARPVQSQPPPQTQPIQKPPATMSPILQEQSPASAPMNINSPSPVQTQSAVSTQSPAQPPARTASVISSGNGGTSISYATAGGSNGLQNVTVKAPKPKKQPKVIYYNEDHYRMDPPTQHPPRTPAQTSYQAKFQSIKPSVFCNDHYLKGHCKWGISCDKTHDAELTAPELAIHRYKARTSLCPQGPYCVDYDCYLSHHCPRTPCTRGDTCGFNTEKWGDLHLDKDQLQPKTKWTEGSDLPEHLN